MKRWLGVLTLMVLVSVAYMDRINVSLMITNADFLRTMGIEGDRIAQGRLMSLFLFGYGVSALVVTPLFEAKWTVRMGLLLSIAMWTAFTGASALTASVALFLVWRLLLGVSEGPLFSLKTMYVKEHFEAHEVGKPNAVSSLGVSIGLGTGYTILGLLIAHFGWRDSFWALAGINVVVGLPLVLLFVRAPAVPRARPAPPAGAPVKPDAWTLLKSSLRTPHLGWILVIEICTLSYLWGASTWLPSYLKEARHFSLAQMSVFAGLPFIVGILANLLGGTVIDILPVRRAPLAFVVGGIGTSVGVTVAILADNPYVSAIALIFAGAAWGFQAPAIPTLVQHVSRPGTVGTTYGVINGVGNLVSALMPMLMGAAMTTHSGDNLGQGFWLLVGTQLLTIVAGAMLLMQLKRSNIVDGVDLVSVAGPAE